MDDLTEARRAALRRFVGAEGGPTAVGAKYNLSISRVSYLSQLISKGSKHPFGEKSARNWETALQMTGHPLLHPTKESDQRSSVPPDPERIIHQLGELLRRIEPAEREVIANVLTAYAKRPLAELGTALITLLKSE